VSDESVPEGNPSGGSNGFVSLGFARVDTDRDRRQGAPEAILAAGKTGKEVGEIAEALLKSGATSVLATRCDTEHRDAMFACGSANGVEVHWHERARCAWIASNVPLPLGEVVIVSAGTSDTGVVHEARIRAELIGTNVVVHEDCGVAGLHRLIPVIPDLERAMCVVVVAGMDAALASVVGGLTPAPVIAVPTSTGYGAAFGGVSALLAMLNSCAAAVAVVNIDDGFSAGTIAARIARMAGGATR
jgi:pyridinium-3,5-biscarboxylic acid mononucleotide synthase